MNKTLLFRTVMTVLLSLSSLGAWASSGGFPVTVTTDAPNNNIVVGNSITITCDIVIPAGYSFYYRSIDVQNLSNNNQSVYTNNTFNSHHVFTLSNLAVGTYRINYDAAASSTPPTGGSYGHEDILFTVSAPPIVPGAVAATTTSGCAPSYTTQLSLSGTSGATGYQWQSSANGNTNWVNIANATGTTYVATVSASGYYRAKLTSSGTAEAFATPVAVATPTAVSGNTVVTTVSCFGGSNGAINLTPTGSTAPYTFLWNNGATTEDRTGLTSGTYSVTITDNSGCTGTVSNINVSQPASAVDGSTVVTNVSCYNGSNGAINLTSTGGTPGYTYQWSDGATTEDRTGLTAGTYSVTITDANSCTRTVSNIIVTQPSAITVSGSQTNASCNTSSDGTATVNVSGGSGAFSYAWYPSGGNAATAGNLAPGSYIAFIFDTYGCSASKSFTINADATIVPSVSVVAPASAVCYGAPATFTTSANFSGGTYAWSHNGSVIPNETGTTLTLSDISKYKLDTIAVSVTGITGCVTTDVAAGEVTMQAAAPPNPAIVVVSGSKNFCEGGNVTLANSVNASSPFSFSWMDAYNTEVSTTVDFTTTQSGTYTLTITDPATGCTRTATPQVIVAKPLPIINPTASGSLTLCPGGSVVLSESTPSLTFRWKKDGVTNVSTASSYTAKTAGSYALTATLNGCSATSAPFDVTIRNTNTAVSTNGPIALCNGGAVTIAAANEAGYAYQWFNGSNQIAGAINNTYTTGVAGSYKVAITDNGCTAKNSAVTKVTLTTLPTATITQTASSKSAVTLRGNTGTVYGYQWYLDGTAIPNATSQYYTATVNGSYTLELSRNNCSAISAAKVISTITNVGGSRIAAEEEQRAISIYPNPSEGIFNIASEEAVNVIVRDVQGKVVANITNASQVDLTAQPAGMYLMQITDAKGNLLQSERLIKK